MPEVAVKESTNVVWKPYKGSQRQFMSCPYYEVLYHGTRGPGKTDCLLMDYAQHVDQGFGAYWRGILFRKTYKQLDDVIARTKQWFPQIWPAAKYNNTDHTWTFPQGEQLLLRYMKVPEDYWEYHGHQYPWMGWEELTNWPNDKCYEMMKACSRSTHAGMPRKIRSTANPYGVGHNWVKGYYQIGQRPPCSKILTVTAVGNLVRTHVFGDMIENEALMKNDPDYLLRMEALATTDPTLYEAWRLGSWDIVAGGALDDVWDRDMHYIKPFPLPASWHVDRSFDWGSSAPFSILWYAESDGSDFDTRTGGKVTRNTPNKYVKSYPKGTVFVIAEWYGGNDRGEGLRMTNRHIAEGVLERESMWEDEVSPGPADSSIYDIMNEESIAGDMEKAGVFWERANKTPGSRVNGLQIVRTLLQNALGSPIEHPGLFLFQPNSKFPGWGCPKLANHLPVLARDEKHIEDVDTDQEDHDWDALRYRVNSGRTIYKIGEA